MANWTLVKSKRRCEELVKDLPLDAIGTARNGVDVYTTRGYACWCELYLVDDVELFKINTARNQAHADVWVDLDALEQIKLKYGKDQNSVRDKPERRKAAGHSRKNVQKRKSSRKAAARG
jgi:hypothetical protein